LLLNVVLSVTVHHLTVSSWGIAKSFESDSASSAQLMQDAGSLFSSADTSCTHTLSPFDFEELQPTDLQPTDTLHLHATALGTNSRMPGRRIRVPNIYNVHIPVEVAADSQAAHSLLVALIKHLSYAREQCHAPHAQLEVHAKASAATDVCKLTAANLWTRNVWIDKLSSYLQACKQQQQQQLEQKGRRKRLPPAARKAVKVSACWPCPDIQDLKLNHNQAVVRPEAVALVVIIFTLCLQRALVLATGCC
jgi:hypothetical protein